MKLGAKFRNRFDICEILRERRIKGDHKSKDITLIDYFLSLNNYICLKKILSQNLKMIEDIYNFSLRQL